MDSYVERAPAPELAGVVRAVWIQRTGAAPYAQRHLPTGGVEIHVPLGGEPQLLGPLTGPAVEVIPPHTTVVGVRFRPGSPPPVPTPLDALVDQRVPLAELWDVDGLVDATARAATPDRALAVVQARLLHELRRAELDPVADREVVEAVRQLMPWHRVDVGTVATRLALSPSQLRRRCLHTVGLSPKVLQRTLRFQGFLALAQARPSTASRTAGLALDVGYADQAHLGRECLRLTGLTPRRLLGDSADRCGCGHDHAASYLPFLAGRRRVLDSFKTRGRAAPRFQP